MGIVIQAQKAGILRDIISADRAFTIVIAGQPEDFTVHVGIGRWIQNLAVAAVETLLLSWLFLAVDVPEMLWTRHVEDEIVKKIAQIVERTPTQPQQPSPVTGISCTKCGALNSLGSNFCRNCGAEIKTK